MKKITTQKIKKELKKYCTDEATFQLIENNVSMYNDLVELYNKKEKVNVYVIYQLNTQITKQLDVLRKNSEKNNGGEVVDAFTILKNKIEKR